VDTGLPGIEGPLGIRKALTLPVRAVFRGS
jgi:hypothetical protein